MGQAVGRLVGFTVGLSVGLTVGLLVGFIVGFVVGLAVDLDVGLGVIHVGRSVGRLVGCFVVGLGVGSPHNIFSQGVCCIPSNIKWQKNRLVANTAVHKAIHNLRLTRIGTCLSTSQYACVVVNAIGHAEYS